MTLLLYRTQTDVLELLAEFGIETYKQHTDGINVLLLNVGDKFLFNGVTPPLPWLSLIDTENCIRKVLIDIGSSELQGQCCIEFVD